MNTQYRKNSLNFPWKIFLIIFIVAIIGISTIIASLNRGYKITAKYIPLIDSIMMIKLESANTHLLLIESISGKKKSNMDEAIQHMKIVHWHAVAMLEGGESAENTILPLTENHIREHVEKLLAQLPNLNSLMNVRYAAFIDGQNEILAEEKYHLAYESFLELADYTEAHIHEHVQIVLDDFKMFNYFMIGFIVIISLIMAAILYRNEKQRIYHLQVIFEGQENLEQLSMTDKVTDIANRRAFDIYLEVECKRAIRDKTSLTLMMLDVDYFKQFNDHYGHMEGDYCLREIAETLQSLCHRQTDLAARYGGEEFAIILPNINNAPVLADRFRKAIENLGIVHEYSTVSSVVTISIGFCIAKPGLDATPDELILKADKAMYQAKSMGRNRVEEA